jgi:enoyl-CoA hydratase
MDKIIIRREGPVGHIVFNNPERHNAVSFEMWKAFSAGLRDLEADEAVRILVISGAGEKAFVSGADISKFEDERAEAKAIADYDAATNDAYLSLLAAEKPTIAMIQGYCIGGGMNLAACCDFRIVSDRASFAIPAAKLGIGYDYSRVKRIVDLVGHSFAKEIFFTGRRFSAQEAYEMGLVNRVVPHESLLGEVEVLCVTIAENAPLTIRAIKFSANQAVRDPESRDLEKAYSLVQDCYVSADYAEGRRAFVEKRKPRFTGA